MTVSLPALRRGQPHVDGPEQRVRDDPERLAVDAARDLAELAIEEDPVVELAAPAVQVGTDPTRYSICGNASANVRPSTAIRQRRARAPSMTSMPWSSAVAR